MRKQMKRAAILQASASLPAPLTIAGLIGWFKADYGVYQDTAMTQPATGSGQTVAAWLDASGSGNNALQATSAARPALQLAVQNSLPTIRFDGVGTYLIPPNMSGVTVLFTCCHNAGTKSNYYGITGPQLLSGNTSDAFCLRKVSDGGASFDSAMSTKAWTVVSTTLLQTGAQMWLNGSLKCTLGTFTTGWTAINRLGVAATGSGHWFYGDIGEVLIYSGAIQASDRQTLEAYLKTRWNTP